MSAVPRMSALAPFRVRAFRLQWPADLATSWALEMETIILGWYSLLETQSVLPQHHHLPALAHPFMAAAQG